MVEKLKAWDAIDGVNSSNLLTAGKYGFELYKNDRYDLGEIENKKSDNDGLHNDCILPRQDRPERFDGVVGVGEHDRDNYRRQEEQKTAEYLRESRRLQNIKNFWYENGCECASLHIKRS